MTTRPAPKPIRRVISKPLRNSARAKHCTLRLAGCEGDGTVVFAHFRGVWALSISAKPHDIFGAYACRTCHDWEEGASEHCTHHDRLRALYETQSLMLEAGLITVKGD